VFEGAGYAGLPQLKTQEGDQGLDPHQPDRVHHS
jgi:hypothetical protein